MRMQQGDYFIQGELGSTHPKTYCVVAYYSYILFRYLKFRKYT